MCINEKLNYCGVVQFLFLCKVFISLKNGLLEIYVGNQKKIIDELRSKVFINPSSVGYRRFFLQILIHIFFETEMGPISWLQIRTGIGVVETSLWRQCLGTVH